MGRQAKKIKMCIFFNLSLKSLAPCGFPRVLYFQISMALQGREAMKMDLKHILPA